MGGVIATVCVLELLGFGGGEGREVRLLGWRETSWTARQGGRTESRLMSPLNLTRERFSVTRQSVLRRYAGARDTSLGFRKRKSLSMARYGEMLGHNDQSPSACGSRIAASEVGLTG